MTKAKSKFHIERQHWTKQQKVYKLHKEGKSPNQIARIMGYDPTFVENYREILVYILTRYDDSLKSTTKPVGKPKYYTKVKITSYEIERIRCLCMLGRKQVDIAKMLGITEATLCTYKKNNPKLKDAIDNAEDDLKEIAINALVKRAKGYRYKDAIHASYKGRITTAEVERVLHPSVQAALSILVNKENWRSGSTSETPKDDNESKGEILSFLENAKKE
jgi:DNA-binding CsgD family transcriptional regulator